MLQQRDHGYLEASLAPPSSMSSYSSLQHLQSSLLWLLTTLKAHYKVHRDRKVVLLLAKIYHSSESTALLKYINEELLQ